MITARSTPTGRSPERGGASRPAPIGRLAPGRKTQGAIVLSLGALALGGLLASLLSSQRSPRPPYRLAEECDVAEAMFV
jgi:hypothetical protein